MNTLHCFSLAWVLAVSSTACGLLPHPTTIGQTASAIAPGSARATFSLSGGYDNTTLVADPPAVLANQQANIAIPRVETNILIGVAQRLGVNIHAGTSGVVPGVKWTVLQSDLQIAILPAVGLGFQLPSVPVASAMSSSSGSLALIAGSKVLFSAARFGLFGAIGYDFILGPIVPGFAREMMYQPGGYQLHTINAGLGWEFRIANRVALLPEIDGWVSPYGQFQAPATGTLTEIRGLYTDWGVFLSMSVSVGGY